MEGLDHARARQALVDRDARLAAMDEQGVPAPLQKFLRQRFAEVADFMRNVEEGG